MSWEACKFGLHFNVLLFSDRMIKVLIFLRNGTPYYMKINSRLMEAVYVEGFYKIMQKKIFVALSKFINLYITYSLNIFM